MSKLTVLFVVILVHQGARSENLADPTLSQRPSGSQGDGCAAIRADVQKVAGSKTSCYIDLMKKEQNCNPEALEAAHSSGNNPHEGGGLCTIEVNPALRASRPKDCQGPIFGQGDEAIEKETKCCIDLVVSTNGEYFGPIKRGEVANCGKGDGPDEPIVAQLFRYSSPDPRCG